MVDSRTADAMHVLGKVSVERQDRNVDTPNLHCTKREKNYDQVSHGDVLRQLNKILQWHDENDDIGCEIQGIARVLKRSSIDTEIARIRGQRPSCADGRAGKKLSQAD
jgi:hypothetical protein